jgi:hypothetical protein
MKKSGTCICLEIMKKRTVMTRTGFQGETPIEPKFCVSKLLHDIVLSSINKQTPWPLVRERTIPTDRPPLVGEI